MDSRGRTKEDVESLHGLEQSHAADKGASRRRALGHADAVRDHRKLVTRKAEPSSDKLAERRRRDHDRVGTAAKRRIHASVGKRGPDAGRRALSGQREVFVWKPVNRVHPQPAWPRPRAQPHPQAAASILGVDHVGAARPAPDPPGLNEVQVPTQRDRLGLDPTDAKPCCHLLVHAYRSNVDALAGHGSGQRDRVLYGPTSLEVGYDEANPHPGERAT